MSFNPFQILEGLLGLGGAVSSYGAANKSNKLEQQALQMQQQAIQHQQGIADSVLPLYYNGLNYLSNRAGLGSFDPNGSGGGNPMNNYANGNPMQNVGQSYQATPVQSGPAAMQYGSANANPYAPPMTGKGDAGGDQPNPTQMMQMMQGQDQGMVPGFRLNGYNPMSPMHLSPMAYYQMMMSQGDQQPQQQQRGYGPDTGQGDPNGLPPIPNPQQAQQQAMRGPAASQLVPGAPGPGQGRGFGQRQDINGGNPFALHGARGTLPGINHLQYPQQQGGALGGPYGNGAPMTGGVSNQQLGVYNDPADSLRNAQAQDDINKQLGIQEDQLRHNLGERGLADSSVYGGSLAQLQNNSLDQYANFRRNLAINAGNEQAQRVQQLMNAASIPMGYGPGAMQATNSYQGNTAQQQMQAQQALNNLTQYFGQLIPQPGQSGNGGYTDTTGYSYAPGFNGGK